MAVTLARANVCYWRSLAPLANAELDRWRHVAERIPDENLRGIALQNLDEEGFNAQATTTLATLAPPRHRRAVIQAIVALQLIYDYVDSLLEQRLPAGLNDAHRLCRALTDAVELQAAPCAAYYATSAQHTDDGSYLPSLVATVRAALVQLPNAIQIRAAANAAATRCAEAQARAHAEGGTGRAQLEDWARRGSLESELPWREYLAGAVCSAFSIHALMAAASDPTTTEADALTIDGLYLRVCAITTLLDALVDYEQDLCRDGKPGYTRYYNDRETLADALGVAARNAMTLSHDVPNGAYHRMTLLGVAAFYLSSPAASGSFAAPIARQIKQELGPALIPALTIMRLWRIAKRLRNKVTRSRRGRP